jgi:hypothetical protein
MANRTIVRMLAAAAAVATPLRTRVNSGVPLTPFAEVAGGRFWSSAISFPAEGWVGATSLTFVVLMAT